jgi:hypothetical protein
MDVFLPMITRRPRRAVVAAGQHLEQYACPRRPARSACASILVNFA